MVAGGVAVELAVALAQVAADFIWTALVLRLRKAKSFDYAKEVEQEIYKYIPEYQPSPVASISIADKALGQFRRRLYDGYRVLTRRPLRK